ncbi:MAG: M23 family metallopeptidase [Actinobacteria bacterium]|nr:M23 family metallopeptidase [Actinomycetota bacterium]
MPRGHRTTSRSILTVLLLGLFAGTASAEPPKQIIFPVIGPVQYTNDFGAPRSGHSHRGNDLMAARKAPVVAVEAGRVDRPSWSSSDCSLILTGRSGTEYWYLHMNNDLTQRDDNRGGCRNGVSFAPDLESGMRVRAGQLIGYVGNSGNAAGGSPHLHFELHPESSGAVSPYKWLRAAPRLLYAAPGSARRVRLALYGNVKEIGTSFGVGVGRIAVSSGWRGIPTITRVSLAYAPGFVVERQTESGAFALAQLTSARAGERVSVWTTWFAPTLATQMAGANVLAASKFRLRGL